MNIDNITFTWGISLLILALIAVAASIMVYSEKGRKSHKKRK